ncbi:DUF1499 domain-containing protein [Thalassoglobus polymorphus]|uniref:DUF1499 domain-containing protein n=1 Tax=Thalassoglobus polymorphus TaxID=2527994 RepID=A0A517QNA1_9PLAN|nr:DUF1499 domain-containing protein [Thalassoglobus polymorphus]QDT33057.1 hypothetical protein Mal48_23090 [Thalassoglobus polymorphus]
MLKKNRLLRLTIVAIIAPICTLAWFSLMSKAPTNLGVKDGKLAPCPNSPNCVSTQEKDPSQKMEPIPFEGDPATAIAKVKEALTNHPRTKIVEEKEHYLHAECASLIFRFVDDVEVYVDTEAHLIHFRSASRVGRSDMGVNRKRMQGVRAQVMESLAKD